MEKHLWKVLTDMLPWAAPPIEMSVMQDSVTQYVHRFASLLQDGSHGKLSPTLSTLLVVKIDNAVYLLSVILQSLL